MPLIAVDCCLVCYQLRLLAVNCSQVAILLLSLVVATVVGGGGVVAVVVAVVVTLVVTLAVTVAAVEDSCLLLKTATYSLLLSLLLL